MKAVKLYYRFVCIIATSRVNSIVDSDICSSTTQRERTVVYPWGGGEKRYANVLNCFTHAPRRTSMFVMATGCVLCEVCAEGHEQGYNVYRCDSL